jgi:hypothetical protein
MADRFHGTYPPDFNEGTHPISGGPVRFLSEAMNAATLAGWRRIQLMAKEWTSVRMQAQIKLMSEQGYSIRAIARTLKISRKTVRKILGIAVVESSEPAPWIGAVDWDYVRQEVYGKGQRSSKSSAK